jgi:hypothetical protein
VRLSCTNCDATFDGDLSERCPKCLRRTTVVQAAAPAPSPDAAPPAPWPDGPACPLCLTGAVSAASFLIEIPSGAAQTAETAGKPEAATTARCLCCDACRERVVTVARRRSVLLPVVMIVMLAWPVLLVSELPMRLLHVEKLDAGVIVSLLCAILVAVPLVVLDRGSRAVRKNLEASWLLRQLLARVRAQATGGPERPDEWKVLAEARRHATVVDAPELLRSG